MSPKNRDIYEFGDFRLYPAENILEKAGKPILLKPKAFATLVCLVENHGNLLERSELLDKVWNDSFVEESSVSKCIWELRSALGDEPKGSRYIQTVPKRGYRFVGDIRTVSASDLPDADAATPETPIDHDDKIEPIPKALPDRWYNGFIFPLSLVLMFGFAVVTAVTYIFATRSNAAPILTQRFNIQRLSSDGRSTHPTLTSDGRTLYYVKEIGDQQSIRLRDMETANESELIAGAAVKYYGMSISPDDRYLFFSRAANSGSTPTLFRLSIPAGIPQKIADDVQGWTSVSPDGSLIAYVRCPYKVGDYCSLYVADARTGENERKLITKPAPFRIGANVFTKDGKFVVFASGQSHTASNDFELKKIDIVTKEEFGFRSGRYFYIRNIARLGDSNSLVFSAVRSGVQKAGLWKVDNDTDQIDEIGKEDLNFNAIAFNKEASLGVSSLTSGDFYLQLISADIDGPVKELSFAAQSAFLPDGRILFASDMSGQRDIWVMKPDGGDLRQLTSDTADELSIVASADGTRIFYSSTVSGDLQIWRINVDGTDPVRITKQVGGHPLRVSPDNRTLFYQSNIDDTLWSVDVDGASTEKMVAKLPTSMVALSPDTNMIAYQQKIGNNVVIAVSSVYDQRPKHTFLAGVNDQINAINWSEDGGDIYYLQSTPGVATIFRQPINASEPIKIRDTPIKKDLTEKCLAVSYDGRQMTVVSGEWKHDLVLISGLKHDRPASEPR